MELPTDSNPDDDTDARFAPAVSSRLRESLLDDGERTRGVGVPCAAARGQHGSAVFSRIGCNLVSSFVQPATPRANSGPTGTATRMCMPGDEAAPAGRSRAGCAGRRPPGDARFRRVHRAECRRTATGTSSHGALGARQLARAPKVDIGAKKVPLRHSETNSDHSSSPDSPAPSHIITLRRNDR